MNMGCDRDKNYPRIEGVKTVGKRGEDKLAKRRCGEGSGNVCCDICAAREKARSAIGMWF
ncbi:hypothetical protein PCI56_01685 [Plesiomonas shigelloides subsp. oncorhynchi]|nr:hypothetical protein [Plesiomonas shigelloides]